MPPCLSLRCGRRETLVILLFLQTLMCFFKPAIQQGKTYAFMVRLVALRFECLYLSASFARLEEPLHRYN